jgi:signal transduction histidine kinase
MVGGVAGGIAGKLGLDPVVVRFIFALMSIGGGTGLALYAVAWLFIPRQGADVSIINRAMSDRRTVVLGVAFGTGLVAVLLALSALGVSYAGGLLWPLALGGAALVVVWRGAEEEERAYLRGLGEDLPILGPLGRRSVLATAARVLVGAVLVLGGLSVLSVFRRPLFGGEDVVAAAAVLGGFLVAFGPWWLRVARDLSDERRERVRAEERATMAATVHDSVLQTLALIQKASSDPAEVTRLARAQERELRSWLFDGRAPGSFEETHLVDAVGTIEREVEADHKVAVDAVVVGDCELGDEVRALLAAGREAAVNAAKWSGAATVSIFVEAEPEQVSMFVRDRGTGFDPDAVDADRKGVSESIHARMARYGGSVRITSTMGEGTEVELVMPLPRAS